MASAAGVMLGITAAAGPAYTVAAATPIPSPTLDATYGRIVAVASTTPPLLAAGWNAMNVREGPAFELRSWAKSSPSDGVIAGGVTL